MQNVLAFVILKEKRAKTFVRSLEIFEEINFENLTNILLPNIHTYNKYLSMFRDIPLIYFDKSIFISLIHLLLKSYKILSSKC